MPKSKGAGAAASTAGKDRDQRNPKPYNRYNIFYMLERELFLQSHPDYGGRGVAADAARRASNLTGYEGVDVPDLPSRYARLKLDHDWYMPGKRQAAKRVHKKSHGVVSFKEIAGMVADKWKIIDDETLEYCTEVARLLMDRHKGLKKIDALESFRAAEDSSEGAPPKRPGAPGPEMRPGLDPRPPLAPAMPKIADLTTGLPAPAAIAGYASAPAALGAAPIPSMADFSAGLNSAVAVAGCAKPPAALAVVALTSHSASTRRGSTQSLNRYRGNGRETVPDPPSVADTTVYSQVDIPDQAIMAMWYK